MVERGFEWFVAWRHLRDPDRGRQRALKVAVFLIVIAVLASAAAWWLGEKGGTFGGGRLLAGTGRLGRVRLAGILQNVSTGLGGVGGLLGFIGLLFRFFTVFTAFSIFGVFLGTAAPIVALSVMSGFEMDLKNKIRGSKADVVISRNEDVPFSDWQPIAQQAREIPGVVGATPFLEAEVMMLSGRTPAGVNLRGIDPRGAGAVIDIERKLKQGKLSDLIEKAAPDVEDAVPELPNIILGEELYARILRVFTGDEVDVMCPLCLMGPSGPMPKLRRFRVSGHFYSGMYEFDSKIAYVDLAQAQRFMEMPGEITGIDIRTATPELARVVADTLAAKLPKGYDVRSWEDMNKALFMALRLEKIAMFIVLTFIGLVASFSIVSNLFMLVTEKSREVAILKSMGASNLAILRVFLTEGLYIGLLGIGAGLLVGTGTCALIDRFGLPLPTDIYYIERLPVVMRPAEIAGIIAVALGLSCLAALYPAVLASRLKPVEGLRFQ